MATYYTDWANGNDNITAITGATFTESTKNLNKASAFTNYTANMRIHIDAGTAVVDAIYKVASVTDNDNVVLTTTITSDASDPTDVGVAASAGTSEALAWATIDHAMNQVAAGDKVWVQGGTNYDELVTIDTVGTTTAGIVFEGYTATVGDGGKATIDGESSRTNCMTTAVGIAYYRFVNFIFENATADGFCSLSADGIVWENCEFNSNGSRGVDVDNAHVFFKCKATGNSGTGFGFDTGAHFYMCDAFTNTLRGIKADGSSSTVVWNCTFFNNGGVAIQTNGSAGLGGAAIINCTVDGEVGNTTSAISQTGAGLKAFINNILYDCLTGITTGASFATNLDVGSNNLLNSNSTADYAAWGAPATDNDITSAPGFTDEGSQDYTLAVGSAARNAGADNSGSSSPGMDIGAHQSAGGTTVNAVLMRPRRTM